MALFAFFVIRFFQRYVVFLLFIISNMSTLRFKAVEEAFSHKAVHVDAPEQMTSEYYGKYVFNRKQMAKYLSKETMNAQTINNKK